jgi:2-keto-3-deoxy-L-rhamnonate aldolase RhmA
VEHVHEANDHVLVVPLIESVTAAENIASLLQVEGVELFLFGPSDFSSTAGYAGEWEGPGVSAQILATKDAIVAAGKHCGLLGTSNANLLEREQQGFRLLGLGFDSGLLLRALTDALAAVGRDTRMNSALDLAQR